MSGCGLATWCSTPAWPKEMETLGRVRAILMPLEAERDLRLAPSAEANDFIEVLIRLRVHSLGNSRQDHLISLLQNRARLDLVHEAAFAFKSVTHRASHIVFYCLVFFAAVKGSMASTALQKRTCLR